MKTPEDWIKENAPHVECKGGINWTWYEGFTSEQAEFFIAFLDAKGYEHRGIYRKEDGSCAIRWR